MLGLSIPTTDAEVKKAYKSLALKWHPDKNKASNAEDMFKQIKEASEALQDAEMRNMFEDEARKNELSNSGYFASLNKNTFVCQDCGKEQIVDMMRSGCLDEIVGARCNSCL